MSSTEQASSDLTPSQRARLALDGLSVGDAFGQKFFTHLTDDLPTPPWRWTDDTIMAISVVENLETHGAIDCPTLATAFARRYAEDPYRGYGQGAARLLQDLMRGAPWKATAQSLFNGQGSMGNGGAMRVAPLGAWFADAPLEVLVDNARRSAEVTHTHPEGQAGAVAVAVATAWAWQWFQTPVYERPHPMGMVEAALNAIDEGPTANRLGFALELGIDGHQLSAVNQLGNGSRITAPDTVPFCLWAAARHLGKFEKGLWFTMRAGGDIDTNCAIVGGILAMTDAVPPQWLTCREYLPIAPTAQTETR
ncbi:MAG: ADP-ribosylglycohydrolase family protein [Bradymonadia bacterium]